MWRSIAGGGFLIGAVAALSACRQASPSAATRTAGGASLESAIDGLVNGTLSSERIPGMSVAIVENGRVMYAKGTGTLSITAAIRPTADTQYRLASVSKPFTAAGVFQLVQDGQIKLDDPAREYCPELAALNGAPTVRHFLMHRSGMRHSTDAEDTTIQGAFPRLGAALTNIVREPLQFPPGRKTLYTSWGYAALGCVIETVSERPYADFMKERVFAPARLTATTFDHPAYTSPTFSSGFRRGLFGLRPSKVVDTRFKTPASGIISTVNDLARFAVAIFDRRLVTDSTAAEMFSVQPDPEGRAAFTAGWSIDSTGLSRTGKHSYGQAFDFNGAMEGATAYLDLVPAERYALALLANRERYVREVQPIVAEARRLVLETAR
jgi:CubicO group peptidase (beta-lactamase class C family)